MRALCVQTQLNAEEQKQESIIDPLVSVVGTKLASVIRYIERLRHAAVSWSDTLKSISRKEVQLSTEECTDQGLPFEKFIIFSQYDNLLKTLCSLLNDHGVPSVICQGNGAVRQRIYNRFNSKHQYQVILLSSVHSAAGANLTSARNIIFLDPPCPSMEAQAIARAHRIGQVHPVRVARFLIKDTIEENV